MIKKIIKYIVIFCFSLSYSYAEVIKDIQISGNKRISNETIIVLGETSISDNFESSDLNNTLKNNSNKKIIFADISSKNFVFSTIVGLVTFRRNKYMTVRGFKIGSGTRKKRKSDVLIQPRNYFQYFVDLRKKCIFDHIYTCFTCFFVFYV